MIDRDRLKAFLDDLALISVKHGARLECMSDAFVGIESGDVQGYVYNTRDCRLDYCWFAPKAQTEDEIASIDVFTITAHQRIALARSLAAVSAPTYLDRARYHGMTGRDLMAYLVQGVLGVAIFACGVIVLFHGAVALARLGFFGDVWQVAMNKVDRVREYKAERRTELRSMWKELRAMKKELARRERLKAESLAHDEERDQ